MFIAKVSLKLQALSVLPLSGGLCVVRHLEFEVDSSCLLSARRRRKKCGSFFCEKNRYKDRLTSYLVGNIVPVYMEGPPPHLCRNRS